MYQRYGVFLAMNYMLNYIDDVMSDSPLLLSPNQTADLLNISRSSVYRLIDSGELDTCKIAISTDAKPSTRITNQSVRNLLVSWSTQST